MKSSRLVPAIIIIAVAAFVIYSLQGGSNEEDYSATIQKERSEKEVFMKKDDSSPFIKDNIPFTELQYFPIDQKYRIKAKLRAIESKKVVLLSTSDGKEQNYLEYAYAEFSLDGKENQLLILELMDTGPNRGKLFLAFADETSGNETYGAGRYLDLKKVPAASSVILDFNLAYNPYCAYNESYSCPFPPRENILKMPILAGEKNYHP
ncbi:MAG: DUF1684 domain-containing protein [Cyclobacteriaceae bacterium]|jgi:uncharacterized protein|nr:DUF1684 domain-containing protein [Cyclobacteriaceae bacterium]